MNRNISAVRGTVILLGFLICLSAYPAADFIFSGGVLTIKTDRYEVVWQNGSMTGLKTFLPDRKGKTLTVVPAISAGVDSLPNGIGSFYNAVEEAKKQSHVWTSFPVGTKFPAQHPPSEASTVETEYITVRRGLSRSIEGVRLVYKNLQGEETGILTQELTVDGKTGDLIIKQKGTSKNPGLFGIAFSIMNLNREIKLITPYFGGQVWDKEYGKNLITNTAKGSVFWGDGLIIGEPEGGGSFIVWAEDPRMGPKYFRRYNDEKAGMQSLNFQANVEAPYEGKKEISVCTWRFNTYPGSWLEPAARYKEWMVKTFRMVQRKDRTSWADNISLIWPFYFNVDTAKKMSEVFPPEKTLIMNWGFLDGFNRRIPEYRLPPTGEINQVLVDNIKKVKEMGYRVGIYTSMALVDVETHPDILERYNLHPYYNAPWQEALTRDAVKEKKHWLLYVHPGSEAWREFYAGKMEQLNKVYGIDYLYQDVAGVASGSSGEVEGKNFNEAVVASEKRIREKSPEIALGGEYWTEVNAVQEDFGVGDYLAWGSQDHKDLISAPYQPHPILSFLFSDFCLQWQHNVPIRNTVKFHRSQNMEEVLGSIPVWTTTYDDRVSEARVVLERAGLWAKGFRPWFPERWEEKVVSYMRNPAGETVRYIREGNSTYCYKETKGGKNLVYARINGEKKIAIDTPVHIDGWLAYDKRGPIGLDENRWYCLFPGIQDNLPVLLTGMPAGATVKGVRETEKYVFFQLEGAEKGDVEWMMNRSGGMLIAGQVQDPRAKGSAVLPLPVGMIFAFAEPVVYAPGEEIGWHRKSVVEGKTFDSVMVFPPTGGKGSEVSLDELALIPDKPGIAVAFRMGRLGGGGDGVHYVVRVNGSELWRHFSRSERGWEEAVVPLDKYRGQQVVLSLAVDCGPSGGNTSNDQAIWGDVRFLL